jgi:uncharacterized membrane protein
MVKTPAHTPEDAPHAAHQVELNIAAIARIEQASLENQSLGDRLAGAIGLFVGSIKFVLVQVAFFAGWIVLNRPASPLRFDPFPHSWLMLIVGLEAILLSTFVLIKQQQMQKLADRRAHLNLQIGLLVESEMTKVLTTFQAVIEHLGVPGLDNDEELRDLSTRTEVEQVAQVLDEQLAGPPAPET